MYNLLDENYSPLLIQFCKNKDKGKIKNSRNCEDVFQDKILDFLEQNIENTNIELLQGFLKTGRKDRQRLCIVIDNNIDEHYTMKVDENEIKLKILIDMIQGVTKVVD